MDEARSLTYSINVNANTAQAESGLRNLVGSIGSLQDRTVDIRADTTQAEGNIRRITGDLGGLQTQAGSVGSAFRRSFLDSIDSGNSFSSSLKTGVGGAFSYVGEKATDFKNNVISTAQNIGNGFAHPIETIKNGLGNAVEGVKSKFVNMVRGAEDAANATDDLGDAADGAGKDVDDLGDSADRAGGKFEGFGKALKVVGAGVVAATGLMAALGTAVVAAGTEYESAFAQVQTIMDTSQMSTEDMSASIKSLSSEMGISASELSSTVYNAISATGDTANAVNLAGQASKLATAGFTDTSSALGVLTTAMNAYGLSADEASNISDSLIMVQNLGVTTVAELSSNMGKAIASASAYGVNLTNLESAYVSITKAGINTAEGTTYISSMLKELGDSSTDVAKILQEQTGKSFDQLMADGYSLGDVLGVLNESVDGDSTALMNLWSSAEAGKGSAAIIGQGLDTFNENLIAIGNSAGATEEAFGIMADTLEHKTDVFKTTGVNLLSSMYEGMSGQLGELMDFANESMTQLADAYEEGGVPALIDAFGTVLSSGLNMLLEKLPDVVDTGMQLIGAIGQGVLDNLPVLIDAASQIIITLASGIGQSLPELVPSVVETLVSVVDTLISNLPLILDAGMQLISGLAEGILNAIPVLIESLPALIDGILGFISESLPTILEQGANLLLSLATGIVEAIPLLVEQLPLIFESISTFVTENLPTILEQGVQIITNLAMGIVDSVPMLVEQLPIIIDSTVSFLTENLPLILEQGIQFITNLATGILSALPSLIEQLPAIITGFVGCITENLPTIIETGVNLLIQLASGIISAIPQLVAQLPAIISAIVSGLGSMLGQIADVGKNIVEGLWNGITAMGSWIKEKVSGFFGGIVDGVKGLLGIHSPSTVFAGIGDNMAAGLGKGFESTMGTVTKDIEKSIPTEIDGPKIDIPDPDIPSVGGNTPAVADVTYGVNPVIGDFNPPDTDTAPEGGNPDNPDGPPPEPDTGGGGGNPSTFAPVITIQIQGNADDETVENMRTSLRDTVRELFEEFRSEELEQQTLKNQYAY